MVSERETGGGETAGDGRLAAERARLEILSTFGPRVMKMPGPFTGLFRLDYDEKIFQRNYRKAVLVAACNDAEPDRAALAVRTGRLADLAMDVAALGMNDVLMVGAEPLFLLHHVSGDPGPEEQVQLIEGLAEACRRTGCALLSSGRIAGAGAGTSGTMGLAAFVVGVVDHRRMITGQQIDIDDEVIGVAGTGLHGPAYHIVRDALHQHCQQPPEEAVHALDAMLARELLEPATAYAGAVLRVLRYYRRKRVIAGIVHVREGRLAEDISRILPEGRRVRIDPKAWPKPAICQLLQQAGMPEKTGWPWAGAGIGLAMIVRPTFSHSIMKQLQRRDLQCWQIGKVVKGEVGVEIARGG